MKLNFKEDTLPNFTFKDLEYGLQVLTQKRDALKIKAYDFIHESTKNRTINWEIQEIFQDKFAREVVFLDEKIVLVEDEIANRMLTGNDGGMFEHLVLGAKDVSR